MWTVIFAWYNLPFLLMMLFVLLLLGASVVLGHLDTGSEIDADSDIELDTDADLSLETDTEIEIDTDVEVDADAELDTDVDGEISIDSTSGIENSSGIVNSSLNTEAMLTARQSGITVKRRKKRSLLLISFIYFLSFINSGKMPVTIVLSLLLLTWGLSGLLTNYFIIKSLSGYPGGSLLFSAVLLSTLVLSVVCTRIFSNTFGSLFDRKSYHSKQEDYIGQTAIVVSNTVPSYQDVTDGKAIGILDLIDEFGTHQKIYAFLDESSKNSPKYRDEVIIVDYIPQKRLYKVFMEKNETGEINEHNMENQTIKYNNYNETGS